MANMEELHMAASAYYSNASDELRQRATEFFNSMDTNGDGGVSFNEFVQFFVQNGYNRGDPNFFRSLDRNGDGFLDFFEVLTFYYVFKTRSVWCKYCGVYLTGLYFTCVECFDHARGNTYDLCSTCYGERRHQQHHYHHNNFLDSYVLLRARAGLPAGAQNLQQALVPSRPPNTPRQRWTPFQLLEMTVSAGYLASQFGCSIM
ncbi:uncharacterized protein LOC115959548 [Quercus lobata]|uniref:uncharacterized protein LOC115959548 n=1 Tax=Quercus lobata TaxID=97700 RepID=UPI0012446F47|nr:uncharacterized protein LOC115959548 [Quercus lobata]XP_030933847.1 uncharacterized protein LOC115959548 [Quercus lobata]